MLSKYFIFNRLTLRENDLSGGVHDGNSQGAQDKADHHIATCTVKLIAFGDTPCHPVRPVHVILKHNQVMGMSQKL